MPRKEEKRKRSRQSASKRKEKKELFGELRENEIIQIVFSFIFVIMGCVMIGLVYKDRRERGY